MMVSGSVALRRNLADGLSFAMLVRVPAEGGGSEPRRTHVERSGGAVGDDEGLLAQSGQRLLGADDFDVRLEPPRFAGGVGRDLVDDAVERAEPGEVLAVLAAVRL